MPRAGPSNALRARVQVEYLKNIFETLKLLGHELLYMGYCMVMFVVNVLGAVVSSDQFSTESMLKLAMGYMEEFVKTSQDIIVPLLDAAVSLLFGQSPLGKILKEIIAILCQIYNVAMENFYQPYWCTIIRPALYIVLTAIEGIFYAFFLAPAANLIKDIQTAIMGLSLIHI